MKRASIASFFFIVVLLAGFLLFHRSRFQKERPRESPSVGEIHKWDQGVSEVISGKIASIDSKEQMFMLDHGMRVLRFHWRKETAIMIANHPVKPSALVPGALVIVRCQFNNDQDFVRSIQILPTGK